MKKRNSKKLPTPFDTRSPHIFLIMRGKWCGSQQVTKNVNLPCGDPDDGSPMNIAYITLRPVRRTIGMQHAWSPIVVGRGCGGRRKGGGAACGWFVPRLTSEPCVCAQ